MEKWQKLLFDRKDKKGWHSVFGSDARCYIGLRRAYDCIQFDDTTPNAGRAFYADFLDEARDHSNGSLVSEALAEATTEFRLADTKWRSIATTISESDAMVQSGCQTTERITELMDSDDPEAATLLEGFWLERLVLREECDIPAKVADSVFEEIAEQLGELISVERRAVELLQKSIGDRG